MTSLHFNKSQPSYKGQTPTHWTCESMRHCSSMSGGPVGTTPEEAVRLALIEVYTDRDDGSEFKYIDGDMAFGCGKSFEVFGVIQVGNECFWTGHVKRAVAHVAVVAFDVQQESEKHVHQPPVNDRSDIPGSIDDILSRY